MAFVASEEELVGGQGEWGGAVRKVPREGGDPVRSSELGKLERGRVRARELRGAAWFRAWERDGCGGAPVACGRRQTAGSGLARSGWRAAGRGLGGVMQEFPPVHGTEGLKKS